MKKLKKTKLKSEFTFGFELEAFAPISDFVEGNPQDYFENGGYCDCSDECCCEVLEDDTNIKYWCDVNDENMPRAAENNFYNCLQHYFSKTYNQKGYVVRDGSLNARKDGYHGFEYTSPVLKFTPQNIYKTKKFLKALPSDNIWTNNTCGFHIHMAYEGFSEFDATWLIVQIASKLEYIELFSKFITSNSEDESTYILFNNDNYASDDFLYNIFNCIMDKKYDEIVNYISSAKYHILRIHPQGTLEWRGPRNFMNDKNTVNIDKFFNKMEQIVTLMNELLVKEEVNGLSKADFFNYFYKGLLDNYSTFKLLTNTKKINRNKIKIITDEYNFQDDNFSSFIYFLSSNNFKNIGELSKHSFDFVGKQLIYNFCKSRGASYGSFSTPMREKLSKIGLHTDLQKVIVDSKFFQGFQFINPKTIQQLSGKHLFETLVSHEMFNFHDNDIIHFVDNVNFLKIKDQIKERPFQCFSKYFLNFLVSLSNLGGKYKIFGTYILLHIIRGVLKNIESYPFIKSNESFNNVLTKYHPNIKKFVEKNIFNKSLQIEDPNMNLPLFSYRCE